LDQGRLRGSHRSIASHSIELGNEPPLSVDGGQHALVTRRRVSIQWLSGTILTGCCGAALMGGAVFASLDGQMTFATTAERIESTMRDAFGGVAGSLQGVAHKSDRLLPPAEANVVRNVIRVSAMSRAGNRELVRVRPYVRVAGNLALSATDLSAKIPKFNPQRILAETDGNTEPEVATAEPDAEVSFVMRDLSPILPKLHSAVNLPVDDVLVKVRQAANWTGPAPRSMALASVDPRDIKLNYAPEEATDPYASLGARIVPENVTFLPKTSAPNATGASKGEKTIVVRRGDTLLSILMELGATAQEVVAINGVLGLGGRDGALREGEKLRVLMQPVAPGQKRLQPVRVIVADGDNVKAVAALSDMGQYVPVDARNLDSVVTEAKEDEDDDGTGIRLYQSLYETALRNKLPQSIIDNLIRIYSFDVDFQRRVQPGDAFEVLYTSDDDSAGSDSRTEVTFASLTLGGEVKKFYRFHTPDDDLTDFYDESGKSAKKFLVRKPVAQAIMRSGFGFRRHPILGMSKMHTGVDWAAPTGTPIFAAGNGTVEWAKWESGYGKYVRIKHANGYETAYGHMTAFARGIEEGTKVHQGQVIGFVGSTGLSTGSHVHFEILINGRFVDPMKVRLPRGRVLEGPLLAKFEVQRNKIDAMRERASTSHVAQVPATEVSR
jgi:murein DD-endopeptidase MepM/ murein hydrolase activator NlpD